MKPHPFAVLALLPLLLPACQTGKTPPAEAQLTRDEVLNYLDGKPLPLDVPGAGEPPPETPAPSPAIVLKREYITALEPQPGVRAIETEPWTSTVTFLYNNAGDRYAVEAAVDHKLIENQRAFFGFRPKRVARQ